MIKAFVVLLALVPLLGACGEDREVRAPPPAQEPTRAAISHFDQMVLLDHEGPKAQIHLESRADPIWFSSVRDAFAFSMLPEEPRDIAAIYVTDMARAASWADPGPGVWIEARDAHYVLGSAMRGGMGAEEPVPFGDHDAALAFAGEHGGEVVAFGDVPQDYVLGATAEPPPPHGEAGSHGPQAGHGHRPPGAH
jgi:copper chaperone NosL